MQKKWYFALFLAALLLITALYSYRSLSYASVHPQKSEITEAIYGLGRVKSNKRFEVIIGVISTVTRLWIDEGSFVKKGDPLIAFESQSTFRAPFPGTVTLIKAREGETALPNTVTLRLEDLQDRFIELSLEQEAALRIKPGNLAKVSFESLRGETLEGRVEAIYSRENEFLAKISVVGMKPGILPGMTADVTVEIGKIPDALILPLSAIQSGMVTVKRDGHWKKIKVTIGYVDGVNAEIKDDSLKLNDEIRIKKE